MKTKLTLTLLCLLCCLPSNAQLNQQDIETQMVLAQDYMRQKNYEKARPALHWLLTNAPKYKASVYIMAYKAYEKSAELIKAEALKISLLDSMMHIYSLKEQHFGLTDLERNNIAYRYYKYYRKDSQKLQAAMDAFAQVFEKPDKVILNNLPAYMSTIRQYNAKVKQLPAEELMEYRATIARAEAAKRAAGTAPEKLRKFTNVVDQMFYQSIQSSLSCEVIEALSSPEKLENYDFARMIFAWSLDFECSSFDFFESAARTLVKHPEGRNAGILVLLAKRAAAKKEYAEAIDWFEQAQTVQTDDHKKATTYMDMAQVYALQNMKAKARETAFKAAKTDSELLAGSQSFVANLYMASFDECAGQYSVTDDRAVFMAAYDLFQKAGDTAGMQAARAQFPTRSQAHAENYADGDVIDIGCWMNTKTKVRTRTSQ